MQKLNCLILEDERLAADVLKEYVSDIPGLQLCAVCSDALEANEYLRKYSIDLLFVDIHLPKINGIDFVKTLKGNYHVIFTTAYHQYAVEGFNVSATDYLLKPIEFSRFLEAVNKVFDKSKPANVKTEKAFHFFNVEKKQIKVFEEEIVYIESLKDYVKIHCEEKSIVTKFQIGELENLLNREHFIRIHKSFLVNLDKISTYSASELEIKGKYLPVGRSYKDLLFTRFKKN